MVRDAIARLVAQLDSDVHVLQAGDCVAGLETAAANPDIDLVLLDLNLPGLCGLPALQRFRAEHPSAPVVIVSGSRDQSTIDEAMAKGAMGFIPKSANRDTVLDALR